MSTEFATTYVLGAELEALRAGYERIPEGFRTYTRKDQVRPYMELVLREALKSGPVRHKAVAVWRGGRGSAAVPFLPTGDFGLLLAADALTLRFEDRVVSLAPGHAACWPSPHPCVIEPGNVRFLVWELTLG